MRGYNTNRTDNAIAVGDLHERVDTIDNKLARIISEKSRPQFIVNKNQDDMYIFELTEDMGTPSAQATIYPMDESETIETDATVMNTADKFSHLKNGEKGVCFAQRWEGDAWREAVYWAILPGVGQQQSVATYFELTADLARTEGATATARVIVTNDPDLSVNDPITVLNRGRHRAFTTARGWALKLDGDWWIVNVNEPAITSIITFALLGSPPAPTGGTHYWNSGIAGSVGDQRPLDNSTLTAHNARSEYPNSWIPPTFVDPSPPGSEPAGSITNPANHLAHGSELALCEWNQQTEHYEIIETLNANGQAMVATLSGNQIGDLDTGIGNNGYPSVDPTKIDFVYPGQHHVQGEVTTPAAGVSDRYWKTLDLRDTEQFWCAKSTTPDQQYIVTDVQDGPRNIFIAVLLEEIGQATPTAQCGIISALDAATVLQSHEVVFLLDMFTDLKIGDVALVVLSGGKFYAVNAPCLPDPGPEIVGG